MQLAHACDDGLFGLLVEMSAERRVFIAKLSQCLAEFVAVFLVFEVHLHLDDRWRDMDIFKQQR